MRTFSVFARFLAATVLIGYGVFTWWMVREADHPEVYWSRLVFLFEGLEAIVFAAAGLIFGTTVHRKQLEDVQKSEQDARRQVDQYRVDADVGRVLETAMRAHVPIAGERDDAPPASSDRIGGLGTRPPSARTAQDDTIVAYLLRLADETRQQVSGQQATKD